ncbi:MAG: hypothetical protein WCB27_01195 [Thermoguttaceae bacterium]
MLERRFLADATARFRRVFVTSMAAMGAGDLLRRIVVGIFPKVGARQLRRSRVGVESPQAIDIRRITAITAGGVGVVTSD